MMFDCPVTLFTKKENFKVAIKYKGWVFDSTSKKKKNDKLSMMKLKMCLYRSIPPHLAGSREVSFWNWINLPH